MAALACERCGAPLREGARFCPECGVSVFGAAVPLAGEYAYETMERLFPLRAAIPLLIIWLVFSAIGVLAALGSGFWYVGAIISGIILIAILVVMWANKGRRGKWGKDRTMWVLTPEGYATGYPPDVARRVAGIGAAGAIGGARIGNVGVSFMGAGMAAENFGTAIHGLPVMPWAAF
ncbi:MAG: zinc-ribbon domain-containing protein, partial [Oscillospiraceae bacterium]|nr:zinc-ribbon domain-containing protein [Oscillospiraceae bacterium]